MFQPGTTLLDNKRYKIIKKIGAGGMGQVYQAEDTKLGRMVAVKVLPAEVANDRRAKRNLEQEAKTAAGLSHPNVVAIYDWEEWNDQCFIIMEFIDGESLNDIAADHFPLPLDVVLDYTAQICAGLHYVHTQKVMHRDIKPHNIMVTASGQVKITDFGISHIVKNTVGKATGTYTGSPVYMAPERFEAKEGNERSDIYSLGVSLYEIVTDDLPFPGPNFAEQHLRVTIPSPIERKPDLNIDPALNAIIMKCLEKNPADRYANADEMLADIRRLQRGETVGGAKKEDEIRKLFDGAQEAAAAENWDRVIELSEKVLRLDPQNESARSGIKYAREAQDKIEREIAQLIQQADNAQKNGNYQSAKQLWSTVLEKRPQNVRAQAGLKKAEESLRTQSSVDKDEWIKKAKAAQQDKNYQIAIDFWQRVLRTDPNHIEAKASLKAAEQALRDQRDKVARISALARAEEEKENFERANQLWQDVLDADPNHDIAKSSIKINNDFIRQGEEERRRKTEEQRRREEEQARANRAIQLTQMETQRWAERAQQYERNGDNQNALQAWQKVLELDPNHSQAQQRIRELTAPQLHKKIEYAVAAASVFIDHLHRPGFDRGMIATFGNTFKIEQGFTDDPRYLQQALANTVRSVTDERTCLYDSIEQAIMQFWNYADRRRPWVLTIITDGQDNESRRYPPTDRYSASRIGEYVRTKFNHEPTNFPFLIAIGDSKTIDANALAIIGQQGGFPAVTLAAFPLLEEIFMRIAVQVSSELVGQQFNYAGMTWQTVQEIRRRSAVAIDYAFLIDRSGSMNDLV